MQGQGMPKSCSFNWFSTLFLTVVLHFISHVEVEQTKIFFNNCTQK